jgi:hypothetical protein
MVRPLATIPRLAAAEMPPELAERLRPRVERLGYLGEFFRCAAHQPRALLSFMALTDDLKEALPDHLTEVVALTIAVALGNAYERVQHERLCLQLGFGEGWLREVLARARAGEAAEAAAGGRMSAPEHLVQRLALAMIERQGHGVARELDAVVAVLGPAAAVAVLMLVGRYVTHALMVNALELAPPVASPLDAR